MEGGKLIYNGSKVCVFTPDIPCKNQNKRSKRTKKRLSKIVFDNRNHKIDKEIKMNMKIKSIKNYKKWAIIFDTFCKSKSYSEIKDNYDNDISKCVKPEKIQLFNRYGNMYQGKLAGKTFADYIRDNYYWTINELQFRKLMKMMKPLFIGLVEMKKNNFIHNDIKYHNIVLEKDKFKYIDFGFSGLLKEKKFFENRSKQEFDTYRFYDWYPVEYLYSYQSKKDLNRELTELNQFDYRKGFDDLTKVHSIYNRDLESYMKSFINELLEGKKINKKKLILSIDVYSLGILIPISFIKITENNILLQRSKCIDEFYKLFGMMTELDFEKRISAEKSLEIFKYLLMKHNC